MRAADQHRRFAVLTFDDGYRDNALYAAPILARHRAPYTIFVTPGFADRTARLWWVELETAIRRSERIDLDVGGDRLRLPCTTVAQKKLAWNAIYARLRSGSEDQLDAAMDRLCGQAKIDRPGLAASLCLDWDELRGLAADPLAGFGAHTLSHPRLAKLSEAAQRHEIVASRSVIEAELDRPVRHFAYPIGDRTSAGPREFEAAQQAGFEAAVTTRPGVPVCRPCPSPDRVAAIVRQRPVATTARRRGVAVGGRLCPVEQGPSGRRGLRLRVPDRAVPSRRSAAAAGGSRPAR